MNVEVVSIEKFREELCQWSFFWKKDIEKSKERNLTLFASDLGNKGEYFASLLSGKKGTGSGGSGFDLIGYSTDPNLEGDILADESKFTCLVQPKFCKKCIDNYCVENNITDKKEKNSVKNKFKIIFFYEKCPKCESNDFEFVNDSRWGIDAYAGVKYKDNLEYYWLQVLEPSDYDGGCRKFNYKCFKISAKDKNFSEYLENQLEQGSKNNCNLLPYSYDFYRFSPIKICEFIIDISGENTNIIDVFWNLESDRVEDLPLDGKYSPNLTKDELISIFENMQINPYGYTSDKKKSWSKADVKSTGFDSEVTYLLNSLKNISNGKNISEYLSIRKKSHGKDRGKTERPILN
jgi:hypothetical protein